MKTAYFLAIIAFLTGCAHNEPATVDSSDAVAAAAIDGAAGQIRSSIGKGIAGYTLSSGDRLEVLFHMGSNPEPIEYFIGIGDRLNVDFFYNEAVSREVVVRPDGKITLPIKGEFIAAGLTPGALQVAVHGAYSDLFNDPVITISVEEFARSDDLEKTLSNTPRGRAKLVTVGPDGKVYLPYLPGLAAAGLTIDQLREEINKSYSTRFGGLAVSVLLDEIVGARIFVFGEVPNPGISPTNQPQTALQAVASVGGPLPTSALTRIKVMYWDNNNISHVQTLDFKEIYDDPSKDMFLPKNSTVYVPPSNITVADRFVDQYLKQLFLFNGTSLGFSYEIHSDSPDPFDR